MNDQPKTQPTTMTSTQARQAFFELIDAAQYHGQITQITKHGKVVAEVRPVERSDWAAYLEELKKIGPVLTDEDAKQIEQVRKDSYKPRFPDW